MTKIHPLFIVFLLFFLTFFTHVKKNELSRKIGIENQNISKLNMELKEISLLKNRWKNSKEKLSSIIKNDIYSGVKFDIKNSKKKIVITAKNMKARQLKTFTNKILNSYFNIKKIQIDKNSQKISIYLEIEL
jgi:hypothetical protein